MTDNKRVEIPLSKKKLTKLLIFSFLFVVVGLWMIITNPQTSNPLFNNVIVKTLASYGSTLMGLLGIYFFTKKLFDKKHGLVVDEQGIYDNSTSFKFGLISWADISEINERSIRASIASKQNFITIKLVDPNKYISREANTLKRTLLNANSKRYGSPIHISTNALETNHKELLKIMLEHFEMYKEIK